jgi:hypothetical protein
MQSSGRDLNRFYTLYGNGGIRTVQARLVQDGIISFTSWDPSPPKWHFRYNTYLNPAEIKDSLWDVWDRFELKLVEGR